MVKVLNEKCTGCGICIDICPVAAISIVDGKASIDNNLCTECGVCIASCPLGAIEQEVSAEQSRDKTVFSRKPGRFSRPRRGRRRRGKRR